MNNFTKIVVVCTTLAAGVDARAQSGEVDEKPEAPINETANEIDQEAAEQGAGGAEGPTLDASDEGDAAETVEGDIRDQSYENPGIDQQVANALSEQGYFAAGLGASRGAFVAALKNFQTLNGLEPTGVITPEVLSKLGISTDEFSPQ